MSPEIEVYEGMIVGCHPRDSDLEAIDTNIEHAEPEHKDLLRVHEVGGGSTMCCVHSVGSNLTHTRELLEL